MTASSPPVVRAQIEEASGTHKLAREYYRQFLRRYDRPMPSQSHVIEEAREALPRLERDQ